jgi:hypothetical protein
VIIDQKRARWGKLAGEGKFASFDFGPSGVRFARKVEFVNTHKSFQCSVFRKEEAGGNEEAGGIEAGGLSISPAFFRARGERLIIGGMC